MRLHLSILVVGVALGLGIGCGSVSSTSDGGVGTGGNGMGGSVGEGGAGGEAGVGAGGSCAACSQSGAVTACPAGVTAGSLCPGTLRRCCAGDLEFQCNCGNTTCAWGPICDSTGVTGGAGGGSGGATGAAGAGGNAGNSGEGGKGGAGGTAGGGGVGGNPCPSIPPINGSRCTGKDCYYEDCAVVGRTIALCHPEGTFEVQTTACTAVACSLSAVGGPSCPAGMICMQIAGGAVSDNCVSNTCRAGPIGCDCISSCVGTCTVSGNAQGIGISCNTCPQGQFCP
jgi:hypothetical protein